MDISSFQKSSDGIETCPNLEVIEADLENVLREELESFLESQKLPLGELPREAFSRKRERRHLPIVSVPRRRD